MTLRGEIVQIGDSPAKKYAYGKDGILRSQYQYVGWEMFDYQDSVRISGNQLIVEASIYPDAMGGQFESKDNPGFKVWSYFLCNPSK